MSKLPVPTAKEINEAHQFAREHAETAVEWAVKLGQMLQRKKDDLGKGKGQFDEWLGTYCKFSRATAYNYIKAGKSSNALDGFNSVREALGYESHKPGHKPVPKPSLTGATADAGVGKEPAPAVPVKPVLAPTAPVEVAPAPQPGAIESAPAFDFSTYEVEDDEGFRHNISAVLMADDKLAALVEELKKVRGELAAMRSSRDHFQQQANEAVKWVRVRDREIATLKRQLSKAAA